MMKTQRRAWSWSLAVVAGCGLLLTGLAVFRWAPEASIRLADPPAAVAAVERHATALGFEIGERSRARFSAGNDNKRLRDPGVVLEAVEGRAEQRRLLKTLPPLRLRIELEATSANGSEGRLRIEVSAAGRLLAARFDVEPLNQAGGTSGDSETSMDWADAIAPRFFEGSAPTGETVKNQVRSYRSADGLLLQVRGQPDDDWRATLLPAAAEEDRGDAASDEDSDDDESTPTVVASLVLVVFGLAMLVLFLWRLGRARLGFGHVKVIVAVVLVYVLGSLSDFSTWVDLLIFVAFGVPSLSVLLACMWAVTEAELRDHQPSFLVAWDRLIYRQPLQTTGGDLVAGVACGAGLAGLFALGGAVGSWVGGGYTRVLGHPDIQLLEAVFLVLFTAFGVGIGGRLLGTRASAILGLVASASLWLILLPVAPLAVRIFWALLLGAVSVGVLVRRGLVPWVVAAITALALPSIGLVAMTWPRWWLGSLVGLVLVVTVLGYGLWLRRMAPTVGSPEVKPAYLSKIERIARLETEVELLRNFQLALLPEQSLVPFEGGEAAWQMRTADQVGGDFLDFVTDEDGRLWLTVADVAGHGIACSMFTAFAKAAIAEHAAAGVTPAQALTRIRRLFRRLRSRRSMVTMILAVWDPRDRTLTVASAGHPPLVVWDGERNREVGPPSRPLGIELPGEDRDETIRCPPGTIVLGYTDGVVEAISPFGEPFGFERWPASLPARSGQSASAILDALLADLDLHCGTVPADDDVTAVIVTLA